MWNQQKQVVSETTGGVKRSMAIRKTASEVHDEMTTTIASGESNDRAWSARSAMNSSVAGYVAGISGVAIGHPFDSAKVWLQTNSTGQNKHLHSSSNRPASTTTPSTTTNNGSGILRSAGTSSTAVSSSAAHNTSKSSANLSTLTSSSTKMQQPKPSINLSLRTLRALYSGVSVPLFTVGIMQSANLTLYDSMRRTLYRNDIRCRADGSTSGSELDYLYHDSLYNVTVAGFCSGGIMAFVSAPLIKIKTRQQVTGQSFTQSLSDLSRAGSKYSGHKRLSPFLNGFGPHLVTESFGRGVYFFVYESCKRSIGRYNATKMYEESDAFELNSAPPLAIHERMASAAIAGIVGWTTIFPLDSLRSRLYGQIAPNPKSTIEMMLHMYRENGVRGFYRGIGVTALRAGPVAAVVLPIYDTVLEKLSKLS